MPKTHSSAQKTFHRYQKQTRIPKFGDDEQLLLSKKHVVLIGAGGLGSNSANLLTRIGVGTIHVIDDDIISLSNLHRTAVFTEDDVNTRKVDALVSQLAKVNSTVQIKGIPKKVTPTTIESYIANADIILDGTDTFPTRFLINDAAVKHHIPWVYAGVSETTGMVMGIIPGQTPCLRCLHHTSPISPAEDPGTFGILPSLTAAVQCMEAIKILLGYTPAGLLVYDTWNQQFEQITIKANPRCSCCAHHTYEFLDSQEATK